MFLSIPIWVLSIIFCLLVCIYLLIGLLTLLILLLTEAKLREIEDELLDTVDSIELTLFETGAVKKFNKIIDNLENDKAIEIICLWPTTILAIRWASSIVHEFNKKSTT